MKHDVIIKRENGTQYQINILVIVSSYRQTPVEYIVNVYYREKGKRNWMCVPDSLYDHEFRALSMEGRQKHVEQNLLNYVTKEEVNNAKLEAWNLLKPEL